MPSATIVTIGNELVSGDVVNTNGSWLARRLEALGVSVRLIASIPDEIELVTSWVEGGAPEGNGAFVEAALQLDGLVVPLASEVIAEESERDARVTLQLQPGYTLTRWTFEPGTAAPRHVHSEEQIVIVVDGEFTFDLVGDVRVMRRGDVCVVPPWVPHGAWTGEGSCLEIDVFVPPRESLLKLAAAQEADSTGADGGGA